MSITYAQKNKNAVQTKRESSVSFIDSSSQTKSLQRKAAMANNAAQRAEAPRPNNTGMPDNLKSGIENLSGFSMDDVRVHYNSSKPATVQALAYTQGTDIHVAPGQEKHLPHEAWHVAQQMAGRVSPTTNINGMPVNDNAALEHEADVMGEKAVQCKGKRRKIEKKNPLNIVQYFTLDSKEFNTFGELREWLDENQYEYILNEYNPKINEIIDRLDQKQLLESTIYDEIEIGDLNSVNSIIARIKAEPSLEEEFFPYATGGLTIYRRQMTHEQYTQYTNLFTHIRNLSSTLNSNLPNSDPLKYEKIKAAFFTQKNINTIIGKFFSCNTGAALARAAEELETMSDDSRREAVSTIKQCIEETLSDIEYWATIDGKEVKKIDLTDSDVHCRGVGVCIITYNTPEGEKKCVIKPEDKSLEKAIYGTDEDSLAKKFGNIGTLDIQVSPNDSFHGSKVQYFEHEDLRQIGDEKAFAETDEGSINDMLRFISILGLRDLHRENLVYSTKSEDDSKRKMQMIDAEIALDFSTDSPNKSNPFALDTETYLEQNYSITNEMRNRFEQKKADINEYNRCIELLDKAQEQFSGKKSRLVIIETPQLYKYRQAAYKLNSQKFSEYYRGEYCKIATDYLIQLTGKSSLQLSCDENDLIAKTYDFLKSGRIPYFEYDFESGEIYQKIGEEEKIPIYQNNSLKLDNVIERRKEILQRTYFEDALAKKQAYYQWENAGRGLRSKKWDDVANYYKALENVRQELDKRAKELAYYESLKDDKQRYFEARETALKEMCKKENTKEISEDALAQKWAYYQWKNATRDSHPKEWDDVANYYKALENVRQELDKRAKELAYYESLKDDKQRYFEARKVALVEMCRNEGVDNVNVLSLQLNKDTD